MHLVLADLEGAAIWFRYDPFVKARRIPENRAHRLTCPGCRDPVHEYQRLFLRR
jgi:hypothetical protein